MKRNVSMKLRSKIAEMVSGEWMFQRKRKTKAPEKGEQRAAKRLDAHRKATAKRLKNARDDFELSRQVRRQMERRAKKMPISLPQAMWHRANNFPKLGGRAA